MRDVKKSTRARTPFRPSCVQNPRGLNIDSEVRVPAVTDVSVLCAGGWVVLGALRRTVFWA